MKLSKSIILPFKLNTNFNSADFKEKLKKVRAKSERMVRSAKIHSPEDLNFRYE